MGWLESAFDTRRDPDRTIFQIKRHMDDPEHIIDIDGKKWTPAEISALILSKLKRDMVIKRFTKQARSTAKPAAL